MIDLKRLETVAQAATPGPWEWDEFRGVTSSRGNRRITDGLYCTTGERNSEVCNGEYIASLDPQTVLAMLKVVRAAQALTAWCDKNPPAGEALYCVKQMRETLAELDKAFPHD